MTRWGFITLSRRFFDGELWAEVRQLSKAEALIDLHQMAPWRSRRLLLKGGGAVELGRGEFLGAYGFLSSRWLWSVKRVRNFLAYLVEIGELERVKKTQRGIIYRLVDYDPANRQKGGSETGTQRAQPGAEEGHTNGHTQAPEPEDVTPPEGDQKATAAAPRGQRKGQPEGNSRKHLKTPKHPHPVVGAAETAEKVLEAGLPADLEANFLRRVDEAADGRQLRQVELELSQAQRFLEKGTA